MGNKISRVISPQKEDYDLDKLDLKFMCTGKSFVRLPLTFPSGRGEKLCCSLYHLEGVDIYSQIPCAIYLHGLGSSQLEGRILVPNLCQYNIAVFCFDFAASGHSGGEYVSFGYNESIDTDNIIEILHQAFKLGPFFLWGRSMGAATALMCKNPKIVGRIADSPYTSIDNLIEHLIDQNTKMGFLFKIGAGPVKSYIKKKIRVDLSDIAPIREYTKHKSPVLIGHSTFDNLIPVEHGKEFVKTSEINASILFLPGTHNSKRPDYWFYGCVQFIFNILGINEVPRVYTEVTLQSNNSHFASIFEMTGSDSTISASQEVNAVPRKRVVFQCVVHESDVARRRAKKRYSSNKKLVKKTKELVESSYKIAVGIVSKRNFTRHVDQSKKVLELNPGAFRVTSSFDIYQKSLERYKSSCKKKKSAMSKKKHAKSNIVSALSNNIVSNQQGVTDNSDGKLIIDDSLSDFQNDTELSIQVDIPSVEGYQAIDRLKEVELECKSVQSTSQAVDILMKIKECTSKGILSTCNREQLDHITEILYRMEYTCREKVSGTMFSPSNAERTDDNNIFLYIENGLKDYIHEISAFIKSSYVSSTNQELGNKQTFTLSDLDIEQSAMNMINDDLKERGINITVEDSPLVEFDDFLIETVEVEYKKDIVEAQSEYADLQKDIECEEEGIISDKNMQGYGQFIIDSNNGEEGEEVLQEDNESEEEERIVNDKISQEYDKVFVNSNNNSDDDVEILQKGSEEEEGVINDKNTQEYDQVFINSNNEDEGEGTINDENTQEYDQAFVNSNNGDEEEGIINDENTQEYDKVSNDSNIKDYEEVELSQMDSEYG